jgi:hypothetical protein
MGCVALKLNHKTFGPFQVLGRVRGRLRGSVRWRIQCILCNRKYLRPGGQLSAQAGSKCEGCLHEFTPQELALIKEGGERLRIERQQRIGKSLDNRDKILVSLHRGGLSFRVIGQLAKLSHQRVHTICLAHQAFSITMPRSRGARVSS